MRKGSNSSALFVALCALFCLTAGCAPALGDACQVSTDCSVQGDRDCDTSAPGGYCTVEDCVEGSCDGEGYCVRFEPDQIRLSSAWCMAKCGRGCRSDYRCVTVAELNAERCNLSLEDYEALTARERDALCSPRAAEMLDDAEGARFCGQEPVESDLGAPEGDVEDADTTNDDSREE